MCLKIIYVKFQGNRLINELAQAPWSLDLLVKLLINVVSWSIIVFVYIV